MLACVFYRTAQPRKKLLIDRLNCGVSFKRGLDKVRAIHTKVEPIDYMVYV